MKSQVPCTVNFMSPDITGSLAVYHPHYLQCQEDTQPETHSRVSSVSSSFKVSGRVTIAAFNKRQSS